MNASDFLKYAVFRRDEFRCQSCGKQTPLVVLCIKRISDSKNNSEHPKNYTTLCTNCAGFSIPNISYERKKQREEFKNYLNEKKEDQYRIISELNAYWSELCDDQYELNTEGLKAFPYFLDNLLETEIREAMELAADKIPIERIEDRVKYFYGICHNKIRAKSGDTTHRTFRQVQKYFLKQRRGSGYHNEAMLKELCRKYPKEQLIRAIDIAFSQGRHNYWEAVCEALQDILGEDMH